MERTEADTNDRSAHSLDVRGAADYLGIHPDTLRKLPAQRSIPTHQDGPRCKLYFRRDELDHWRREGRAATFPALHKDPMPSNTFPSMHSFRHTVASLALLAGESVDEVAFLLGHRDATVTRVVYVHEIADTRRRQMRRSRMTDEYAGALQVALNSDGEHEPR